MTSILRVLPLAGMLCVLLVGVAWRALLQRQRHGTWGVVGSGLIEPAQAARAGIFILVFTLLTAQALGALKNPAGFSGSWLRPEGFLVLSIGGAMLIVAGLVLLVVAQLQMGASWRIGIDETSTPGLIETGLFRFCRNPIFGAARDRRRLCRPASDGHFDDAVGWRLSCSLAADSCRGNISSAQLRRGL
jgi:protein-S-isoprenylcysteine O-methyltransferase Ste14